LNHFASPEFWSCYRDLPESIQRSADKAFSLLKSDLRHRSLRLKKIGRFWSVRVGLHHRALAVESPDGLHWFWIGSHAEYDRIVSEQ
jgi:hypothetical protein